MHHPSTQVRRDSEGIVNSITHQPQVFEEGLEIDCAIRDGLVADMDMYEDLWTHALDHSFRGVDTKNTPMLLAEKVYNSPQLRQKITELMMEKFQLPGLFMSRDACLACYAVGKTTGVVVDVGSSGTVISPVADGWVDTKGLNRSLIGGRAMDAHLLDMLASKGQKLMPLFRLNKKARLESDPIKETDAVVTWTPRDLKNVHPTFDAYARLELARDVKESTSRCAESAVAADPRLAQLPGTPYELPDGTMLDVGIDRFAGTELLIDPSPFNAQGAYFKTITAMPETAAFSPLPAKLDSIPNLIYNSVLRSDPEIHPQLFGNLIITGGGTATEGTPERIKYEMEKLVPGVRVKMMSSLPQERAIGAWLGGSIVASLGSFHELWISKEEYNDFGSAIVDRKCP